MAAVEALNDRPSRASGAAPGSRAHSIGVLVKELDNPYFAGVIAGAREEAAAHGYALLVASSERAYEAERRAVDLLMGSDVAGLIVTPVLDETTDLSHLFELKRRNVPFVLLGEIRGVPASLVDVDNLAAARSAGEYLVALGHTRFVHFGGPPNSTHAEERVDGLRRACSAARLSLGDEDIVPAGAQLVDGYRAALGYFRERASLPADRRPTAVTCFNDLVAIGVCRALRELGLRVPEDVAVIGFDDIPILEFLPVPLTSVRVPTAEMGRLATQLLLRHVEGGNAVPTQKVYLDADLVVRRSTEPASAEVVGGG
jgi:LacI family transcriptional regulator/LacI family repressor for deo operon, udp, cdd, tsx, nupC, and nupG